jgi:hypothetical protein
MFMAVCSVLLYGQQPSRISWNSPADMKSMETEEIQIIREKDLPAGGEKRTYLSSFIFANINEYGVTWANDDKLAMYIYWTDTDMAYVRNLSTMGDAWVPAYIDGNTLWVPNGANIMVSHEGKLYQLITAVVNMKKNTMEARTGIKFTMNEDRSEIVMEPSPDNNNVLGFYTMNLESGSILQAYSKISMKELTDEPVTPPSQAEYKRYTYSTLLGGWRDWENGSWMAFDDDDVYVQGLEWINPEGWVKGSLMNDGSIRIPSDQYIGINGNYPFYYYAGIYEGDFADETAKVTPRSAFFLNHDETTGTYSMEDNECFISGKDRVWGFPVINGKFTPIDIKAGTPMAATDLTWDSEYKLFQFIIPMKDNDGNALDPYLLTYSVFVNGDKHTFDPGNSPLYGETIDNMPATSAYYIYSFDTDLMFGRNPDNVYVLIVKTDSRIRTLGVQLTYDVRGDVHTSEMAQIEVEDSGVALLPETSRVPVAYYGMDGMRLTHPEGLCIVRYSDGSVQKAIISNNSK